MKKNFFLLFSMLALSTSVLADGPYLVDGIDAVNPNEPTTAGKAAKLTCTTDADGCVVITLSKYVEGNGETNFRDVGMQVDGFKYNGEAMHYYFNPIYPQDGNVMKWVPISPADVQCGGLIEFNMHGENKEIMFNVGTTGSFSKASFQYSYGAISATNNTGCISSWPQNLSEYCNAMISVYNDRNKMDYSAYITWETIANGNVEIRISDYGENTGTHFSGDGLASDGFTMKNAEGEALNFSDYFNKTPASNGTIYTLVKKQEVPTGAKIIFNENRNRNINWIAKNNGHGYNHYRFAYTYGTSCPSLEAPAISAIDATKHITFSNPEGAESYNLTIYRGANNLVYSQENIHSGDVVNFVPFIDATYSVYVTAVADGLQPATSAAYDWVLTAGSDPKPLSDICQKTVTDDATKGGPIYLKAETDDDGKIIFTLSGAMSPTWRSGGMQFDQMGVGAAANKLQTYFDKQNQSGENGYVRTTTLTLTPKANQTGVLPGDRIVYTGNVEWYYTEGTEKESYIGGFTFSYIYGTTCTLALDEEADNTAVIAANDGRTLDALLGRSFVGGENFYSLCLPFGLSNAQLREVFGDDYELGKMLSASNENDVVTFVMGTASSIEAGKPYIIRPTADAANPLFRGVTIDADASTSVSFGLAGMRGFYAPSVAEEDEWFLGAANTLYQNSDNSASKAFRAFFQVLGGSPLNAPRIRMLPQTATGMETVQNGPAQEVRKVLRDGEVYILRNGAAYTVFGQRVY